MTRIDRLLAIANNVKRQPLYTSMLIMRLLEANEYSDVEAAIEKLKEFVERKPNGNT